MPAVKTFMPSNGDFHRYDVLVCYGEFHLEVANHLFRRLRMWLGPYGSNLIVPAPGHLTNLKLNKTTAICAVDHLYDINDTFADDLKAYPERFVFLLCHSTDEALVTNRKNDNGEFEYISFKADEPPPAKPHGVKFMVVVGAPIMSEGAPVKRRGRPKGALRNACILLDMPYPPKRRRKPAPPAKPGNIDGPIHSGAVIL